MLKRVKRQKAKHPFTSGEGHKRSFGKTTRSKARLSITVSVVIFFYQFTVISVFLQYSSVFL